MRYLIGLLLAFPLFFHPASHAAEGDLLEPEQAFKFSARVADAQTLEVRYQIADGYYLYKERFKFQVEPADVTLGTPRIPAGEVKQDEFFGRVETYHRSVTIRLPLTRSGGAPQTITLKSTAQGCAEAGVCYPPLTQIAKLDLPAMPSAAPSAGPSSLKPLNPAAETEFLPPEQAFTLSVTVKDGRTLLADFGVAPQYYLYRDKIRFSLKDGTPVRLEKVALPQGDMKEDPLFGKTEVYHQPFRAALSLSAPGGAQPVTLLASYQGCSEKGVCYPPIRKSFDLTLPAAVAAASGAAPAAAAAITPPAAPAAGEDVSESSQIAALFRGGNFWLLVASFFGFGLLLALTPCVFPMIPILSGIIVGQGKDLTKGRAFSLSLAYVVGMAITYAAAGVAAGLSGALISNALQNPLVLGAFALVFVALAFSMFGFYELQMPSFIQSRLSDASNRMQGGGTLAVFIMGALSAVIVGPCVAAPLAGALLYIGQSRDVVLGGSALFAMALGMGAPLLAVGVSAGALLPKAGRWMEGVKNFFGVLLLGVAIWLISPVIPTSVQMLLWAALLTVSAIYLHALDPLPAPASGSAKFWKGLGVIALVAGVSLLIGVLSGGRDILQPLAGPRAQAGEVREAVAEGLKFERVKTAAELDARLKQSAGKFVMLDFYADWCVSCKELERFTFSDPRVTARLRDAVLLQADVTANDESDKALLKKFGLFGPPGIIFFDKSGQEIGTVRVIGYQPPEKFLASLDVALR